MFNLHTQYIDLLRHLTHSSHYPYLRLFNKYMNMYSEKTPTYIFFYENNV